MALDARGLRTWRETVTARAELAEAELAVLVPSEMEDRTSAAAADAIETEEETIGTEDAIGEEMEAAEELPELDPEPEETVPPLLVTVTMVS